MHPNHTAIAAILPKIQRLFPEAQTLDWSPSPEDRYISLQTAQMQLCLCWDRRRGYRYALFIADDQGRDLIEGGLTSPDFTNPNAFKHTLRALITTTLGVKHGRHLVLREPITFSRMTDGLQLKRAKRSRRRAARPVALQMLAASIELLGVEA